MMYSPNRPSPWPRELVFIFLLFFKKFSVFSSLDPFQYSFVAKWVCIFGTSKSYSVYRPGSYRNRIRNSAVYQTIHAEVRKYITVNNYWVTKLSCLTEPLFLINEQNSGDTSVMKTVTCVTKSCNLHPYVMLQHSLYKLAGIPCQCGSRIWFGTPDAIRCMCQAAGLGQSRRGKAM